jgi:hypothetical protein
LKNIIGKLMGTAAATICLAGAAQAEVKPADINQLIASKGLALGGEQVSEGGKLHMFLAIEPSGWPHAISLVDLELDGQKDVVVIMSFIPGAGGVPLQALNQINEKALTKAFTIEGAAGLSFTTIASGGTDGATLSKAFDLFYGEFNGYRQVMIPFAQTGAGNGNALGVSLSDLEDEALVDGIDAGMSRIEVSARDEALTKRLNVTGGHTSLGAYDESEHDAALSLAEAYSKRLLGN